MNNFGHPIMDTIPVLPNCLPNSSDANRTRSMFTGMEEIRFDGEWVEFGVYQANTADMMLEMLPDDGVLHLFDSYEGLARDWSALPAGSFATAPPKFTDDRVVMHDGWFEDTVMDALEGKVLSFIHMDCDLYESTLDALWQLPPLREGTIILFDEYVHNLGDKPVDDEYRAFTEWTTDNNYEFRYLWRTAWTQVCVEIL